MKQLLLIILILTTISACTLTKQQRQSNKVAKKINKLKIKYPDAFQDATVEIVRIDTVLERIEVAGEIRYDTIEVQEILEHYIVDSVDRVIFLQRFMEVARDTARIDTLGIHLRIIGAVVEFTLVKDEQHIKAEKQIETITITNTQVIKKRFYQDWLFWVIVVILFILYMARKVVTIWVKAQLGRF